MLRYYCSHLLRVNPSKNWSNFEPEKRWAENPQFRPKTLARVELEVEDDEGEDGDDDNGAGLVWNKKL